LFLFTDTTARLFSRLSSIDSLDDLREIQASLSVIAPLAHFVFSLAFATGRRRFPALPRFMQAIRLTGFSRQQTAIPSWKIRSPKMFTWFNRRSRTDYNRISSSETRGRSPCCCRCVLIPEKARALVILSEASQKTPGMENTLINLGKELNARGIETDTALVAPNISQLMLSIDILMRPPLPSLLVVVLVAPAVELVPSMLRVSNHVPFSVAMLLSRLSSANVPKLVVVDTGEHLVQISPDLLQKSPDVYLIMGGKAPRSNDSSTSSPTGSHGITAFGDREPNTEIDNDSSSDEDDGEGEFDSCHFVTGGSTEAGFIVGHARGRAGHLIIDECDVRATTNSMVEDFLAELRAHPTNRQPLYLDVLLGGLVRRRGANSVPYSMSSMSRIVALPPRCEEV